MKPDHEIATVNSALWAAAGDALGWMTELAREGTVTVRTGSERVHEPVEWRRTIGGKFGVRVTLPAGTYSDDTQLRLAVCRSIRGNGVFDVEAFARIELTTWQSYALGAGNGTRAAASNLARRGVNWFSNFFDGRSQRYVDAGGNGAAMRIQPHVWAASKRYNDGRYLLSVLKDALSSHGHPHGFCGAVFHALSLFDAMKGRSAPDPSRLRAYADELLQIPLIAGEDRQLADFWRPAWEHASGRTLQSAVEATRDEVLRDLDAVNGPKSDGIEAAYKEALHRLGCLDDRYRGSGLKTAIAATVLAWLYRDRHVEDALVLAANELNSDTDTIATMAGAILGATTNDGPAWSIQDRKYIESEALRLADISQGKARDEFVYPDLAKWEPPSTQSDAVGRVGATLAVAGLGMVRQRGKEYTSDDSIWQWLELPFGQSIFAQRRKKIRRVLREEFLPGTRRVGHSPLKEVVD